MEKSVTPSSITDNQIGKIQELLGARLRKSNLPLKAVQEILENQGKELISEFETSLRKRVKAIDCRDTPFELLDEFLLVVPKGFNHDNQLTSFAQRFRSEFFDYNEAITDDNFNKVTTHLSSGQKLRVKIFGIRMRVSSVQCLDFLRSQKAIFVGTQGLALVYELYKEKFLKNRFTISFDEKEALWVDGEGHHQVSHISALQVGKVDTFKFCLVDFNLNRYDDSCLLCLCDESA